MAKIEHTVDVKINVSPVLPQFRHRRGMFDTCVLQELVAIEPWMISDDPPPYAKTRYEWRDVKYSTTLHDVVTP